MDGRGRQSVHSRLRPTASIIDKGIIAWRGCFVKQGCQTYASGQTLTRCGVWG